MKELDLDKFLGQNLPLSLLQTREGKPIDRLYFLEIAIPVNVFRYWADGYPTNVYRHGQCKHNRESPHDLILVPTKKTLGVTTTSCTNEKPVYALRHIQSGQFVDYTFSDRTDTLTSLDSYPHIQHSDKNYWKENNCIPETCEVVQLIKTTTITAIPV